MNPLPKPKIAKKRGMAKFLVKVARTNHRTREPKRVHGMMQIAALAAWTSPNESPNLATGIPREAIRGASRQTALRMRQQERIGTGWRPFEGISLREKSLKTPRAMQLSRSVLLRVYYRVKLRSLAPLPPSLPPPSRVLSFSPMKGCRKGGCQMSDEPWSLSLCQSERGHS